MIDPRLLEYYQQELLHIREGAGEFAREHPKVAARLALDATSAQGECVDPYVERLLEGFAFLTARVQLRQDGEHARFTQHLLEAVYPGLQAPTPSMAIVQMQPEFNDEGLAEGPAVPRGSLMNARLLPGERTACRFTTAHEVRLWPLRVAAVSYQSHLTQVPAQALAGLAHPRGCLRIRFEVTAALCTQQLHLDELVLHLAGDLRVTHRIYEQLFAHCAAVAVQDGAGRAATLTVLPPRSLQPGGLEDDDALLPLPQRAFGGYRLLKEYAAMPERYLFARIGGLQPALQRLEGSEFELLFVLEQVDTVLEKSLDAGNFALHCTPAINLFSKRADRIDVSPRAHEFHVLADRARPMDYEVHSLQAVTGYDDSGVQPACSFEPLHARFDALEPQHHGHYTIRRVPRLLSHAQRQRGPRTGYIGTELYLALTGTPAGARVAQLGVQMLCSNRDLPLLMPLGGNQDFSLEQGAPVQGIRCIKGPTRPIAPALEGETPWRLISHLSLNYLSISGSSPAQAAAALRELLSLHALDPQSPLQRQLEGVLGMEARQAVARVPVPGPIAFGRGVELCLHIDERPFQDCGALLLATVLERFLARHASLNSFTQLVLRSQTRGEIKRWAPRIGLRAIA